MKLVGGLLADTTHGACIVAEQAVQPTEHHRSSCNPYGTSPVAYRYGYRTRVVYIKMTLYCPTTRETTPTQIQETKRNPAMAYSQPVYTGCDHDYGYPIYLITTPLRNQRKFLSKPIDPFGHWAICIQGYCYELTKNPAKPRPKKDPKYIVRQLPRDTWARLKEEDKRAIRQADNPVGQTARSWPPETIKEIGKQTIYYLAQKASISRPSSANREGKQPIRFGKPRYKANTCTTRITAKSSFVCSLT